MVLNNSFLESGLRKIPTNNFVNNINIKKNSFSWRSLRNIFLSIIFVLFFVFKAIEKYLKNNEFDTYLISVYNIVTVFIIINLVVYGFMYTYNRYRSILKGPKGSRGTRGKRGTPGNNSNCNTCSNKVPTVKKMYKELPKKEYVNNSKLIYKPNDEMNTMGWTKIGTEFILPNELKNNSSSYYPILDNTKIGVSCDSCVSKNNIQYKEKPLIGVASNYSKNNGDINSLQYFIDKNNRHSKRLYKPKLLGNRRFGNLNNKGAQNNFICPKNSAIYKVDSISSNNNIKGLKFYCQDIKTGKDVELLDRHNKKNNGYVFGKEPKRDDKAYYFKSTECKPLKVIKSDGNKYYPTFFSNVSCEYNDEEIKNLGFNKCSYYKDFEG
jgi:hypothetical protein